MAQADGRASIGADAFMAACGQHYAPLVRRLTSVLRDPEAARDLAQEAYLRAYRAWDRFDGTDARAWLYTIGLRLALNERERRWRWSSILGRHSDGVAWQHPSDPDLHDALVTLPARQRAALLLNVIDGYTQTEIAAMLEVPAGTVGSWVSRARAQLREALADA